MYFSGPSFKNPAQIRLDFFALTFQGHAKVDGRALEPSLDAID